MCKMRWLVAGIAMWSTFDPKVRALREEVEHQIPLPKMHLVRSGGFGVHEDILVDIGEAPPPPAPWNWLGLLNPREWFR